MQFAVICAFIKHLAMNKKYKCKAYLRRTKTIYLVTSDMSGYVCNILVCFISKMKKIRQQPKCDENMKTHTNSLPVWLQCCIAPMLLSLYPLIRFSCPSLSHSLFLLFLCSLSIFLMSVYQSLSPLCITVFFPLQFPFSELNVYVLWKTYNCSFFIYLFVQPIGCIVHSRSVFSIFIQLSLMVSSPYMYLSPSILPSTYF